MARSNNYVIDLQMHSSLRMQRTPKWSGNKEWRDDYFFVVSSTISKCQNSENHLRHINLFVQMESDVGQWRWHHDKWTGTGGAKTKLLQNIW